MKRIYIAGAIQGKDLLDSLNNIRKGIKLSVDVLKAGFAPFSPFIDFQFSLVEPILLEEYYAYSMAWLEVSDAVLLVPGYENSKGTAKEIARARELNIPVFVTLSGLELHFDHIKDKENNTFRYDLSDDIPASEKHLYCLGDWR